MDSSALLMSSVMIAQVPQFSQMVGSFAARLMQLGLTVCRSSKAMVYRYLMAQHFENAIFCAHFEQDLRRLVGSPLPARSVEKKFSQFLSTFGPARLQKYSYIINP